MSTNVNLIVKSLDGSLYDIAQLVHYLYNKVYVVGRLKTKSWFKFEEHRWKHTELGPYYELSTTILRLYETFLKELVNNLIDHDILMKIIADHYEGTTKEYDSIINEMVTNCEIITKKLRNVNFKEQICKECLYLFYDTTFLQKLDQNLNLICFKNGVYDKNEDAFRNGKPEDFILIHIDKKYDETENKHYLSDLIKKFEEFRVNELKKRVVKNTFITS